MLQHLKGGNRVFVTFTDVSWISDGIVYHMKKSSITKLYNNGTIGNWYLNCYGNELKLLK